MLKCKSIDRICCVTLALTMLLTVLFMNGQALGIATARSAVGYESRLFEQSRVHAIDIVIGDWEGFLQSCSNEEYAPCSAVIDGETYKNIAIRAKGNTSLSSVAAYGNNRYSFKLEFDQYDAGKRYHGLDKLSLNNLIQDTTCLKDYLSYSLMGKMGISAPLCSFAWITVNGEDWGMYLAVEAVEESFLERNYGKAYGELYKPDSLSFGGGRGNGANFDFGQFAQEFVDGGNNSQSTQPGSGETTLQFPGNFTPPRSLDGGFDPSKMPQGGGPPSFEGGMPAMPLGGDASITGFDGSGNFPGNGGFGGMGSEDVKLKYIDDAPESYANIFDSAKTAVSEADKKRLIRSLQALSSGENVESTLDVESVIRYLAVHDFLCNGDSYTGMMVHNYYLYEKDGVLSMIPWDYNLAFGAFNMGGFGASGTSGATGLVNSPIDSPVSSDSLSERPMVAWIFESETYTALYHQIYAQFLDEVFSSGYFEETLDTAFALISPYVRKDPTAFYSYEEFTKGVEALRSFCLKRAQSVLGQLEGSIPSTSAGQSADSSSLIDASGVQISDMGGMSMGGFTMGGGMPGFPTSITWGPTDDATSGTENTPSPSANGSAGGMPDVQGFGNQIPFASPAPQAALPSSDATSKTALPAQTLNPPSTRPASSTDGANSENPSSMREGFGSGTQGQQPPGQTGVADWPLLVASATVLLIGIFLAGLYKKRW